MISYQALGAPISDPARFNADFAPCRVGDRRSGAVIQRHTTIRQLYISSGHNFFGHHGKPAGENRIVSVSEIECVAGRGIRGDRFFDFKENYRGQITFFAMEEFESLCEALSLRDKSPSVLRRNVITAGMDLNRLIGEEFEIQGMRFRGHEECKPCYWMDQAFAYGAEKFLRGRGGLRASILNDGTIRADR